MLFVMAALILWMGIGSAFFTRRTEASTHNVFQLMQRPQALQRAQRRPGRSRSAAALAIRGAR